MSHQLYRFCSNPNKAEGSQVQVPLDSAFPTKVGDYFRFFGPMNFSGKLFFSPFPAHAIHDGYIMLNPFEILELWSGELDLLFHPGCFDDWIPILGKSPQKIYNAKVLTDVDRPAMFPDLSTSATHMRHPCRQMSTGYVFFSLNGRYVSDDIGV